MITNKKNHLKTPSLQLLESIQSAVSNKDNATALRGKLFGLLLENLSKKHENTSYEENKNDTDIRVGAADETDPVIIN